MTPTSDAFDRAAGLASDGDADESAVAWARRVLALRREGQAAEACPPATLARARALLAREAQRARSLLARLVFDSAAEAAPATRGAATARMLRVQRGGQQLDVEIGATQGGARVVQLVHPGGGAAREVRIELPDADEPLVVALDDDGFGRAEVPADAAWLQISLFRDGEEILRTHEVELDAAR